MSIALVVITDGRGQYLEPTLASAEQQLIGEFSPALIVDDSGDSQYGEWLEAKFRGFWHFHHDQRAGFAAAIRSAWEHALEDEDVTHVFHLEEDFTFNEEVNVEVLSTLLACEPHLAQVSLKRQPVNMTEEAAGGFIQTDPDSYTDCGSLLKDLDADESTALYWVEHNVTFTTNPSLIPRKVIELALGGETTEGGISASCREAGLTFAIFGSKADAPRVQHIGSDRSVGWQL